MTRRINIAGCLVLAAIALTWQVAAQIAATPNFPSFVQVVATLFRNIDVLVVQSAITLDRTAFGLAIAIATMVPLGIMIGRIRALYDVLVPVIDLLKPLPPLAIAPVVMLFAGTGGGAKIFVIYFSCSFPIVINTIEAVRATHPLLGSVARSLGLNRRAIMCLIDAPAALPQVSTGIRTGLAVALLVAVSSEMILSTDGIGNYIIRAQERFQIAEGMSAILLIAIIGLVVNAAYHWADRRLLAWHYGRAGVAVS